MRSTGRALAMDSRRAIRSSLLVLLSALLLVAAGAATNTASAGAGSGCDVRFEDLAEPGVTRLFVRCDGLASVDGQTSETVLVEPIGNSGCNRSFVPTRSFRCFEERTQPPPGVGRDFSDIRLRANDNDVCRDPRLSVRLTVNFDAGGSRDIGTFRPTGCSGGSGGGPGEEPGGPGNSACTIEGTPGNDIIRGTPRGDLICGGAGNDIIYGSAATTRCEEAAATTSSEAVRATIEPAVAAAATSHRRRWKRSTHRRRGLRHAQRSGRRRLARLPRRGARQRHGERRPRRRLVPDGSGGRALVLLRDGPGRI